MSSKLRIALLSAPHHPVSPATAGDLELVIHGLVEDLVARGHEVTLFAPGDSCTTARLEAWFPTAQWPPDPLQALAQSAAIAGELLSGDPYDVIHSFSLTDLVFAPFFERPFVATLDEWLSEPAAELVQATACSNRTLVATSRALRVAIETGGHLARFIPSGLNPERYPLGHGGPCAVYLGRLAADQSPHRAIEAAVRARTAIRVAGPAAETQDYFKQRLERHLNNPLVSWLGELSPGSQADLLGSSLVTILPTEHPRGSRRTAIESMLCGTPVLVSSRGALSELVDEGVTGFLADDEVEMSDRLECLAASAAAFDRPACREHARRRFDRASMVAAYEALFHQLVAEEVRSCASR